MAKRKASRGEYVAHLVNELVALLREQTGEPSRDEKLHYKSLLAEIARVVDGGMPPNDAPLLPDDWKSAAAYAE